MEQALRYFLPAYLVVFVGTVFVWRTYHVWRTTGINAYVIWSKSGVEGFVGRCFRLMPVGSVIVVGVYAFSPTSMRILGEIPWLLREPIQIIGIFLMLSSLGLIVAAQASMGRSWRIGIDESSPTNLVTDGLFSMSRNPVFLGVLLNTLGFFLVLPNALTLLILGMNATLISVQIHMEEEHLESTLGDSYRRYARTTRRWWGRRGEMDRS